MTEPREHTDLRSDGDLPSLADADLPVMLDRFEVLRRIGEGSMGVVFEAYDRDLGRRVAIKVCKPASPGAARSIEHEARSLAKLSHPNIVGVHEILRFDAGRTLALVMDLIDGQTLRQWQATTRPSWRDLLVGYVEAGDALAAVHTANLEHADFKPDNLLVDLDGRVHVVDFGIALHSSPSASAGPEFAIFGTSTWRPSG